ncbi:MAG: Clp protease N-terminal domain-containing protein, partial [Tepidisphaeraceae bacterium]
MTRHARPARVCRRAVGRARQCTGGAERRQVLNACPTSTLGRHGPRSTPGRAIDIIACVQTCPNGGRSPMREAFTDTLSRAIAAAQTEARQLNQEFVGTEHLLLGLLDTGDASEAPRVL